MTLASTMNMLAVHTAEIERLRALQGELAEALRGTLCALDADEWPNTVAEARAVLAKVEQAS